MRDRRNPNFTLPRDDCANNDMGKVSFRIPNVNPSKLFGILFSCLYEPIKASFIRVTACGHVLRPSRFPNLSFDYLEVALPTARAVYFFSYNRGSHQAIVKNRCVLTYSCGVEVDESSKHILTIQCSSGWSVTVVSTELVLALMSGES